MWVFKATAMALYPLLKCHFPIESENLPKLDLLNGVGRSNLILQHIIVLMSRDSTNTLSREPTHHQFVPVYFSQLFYFYHLGCRLLCRLVHLFFGCSYISRVLLVACAISALNTHLHFILLKVLGPMVAFPGYPHLAAHLEVPRGCRQGMLPTEKRRKTGTDTRHTPISASDGEHGELSEAQGPTLGSSRHHYIPSLPGLLQRQNECCTNRPALCEPGPFCYLSMFVSHESKLKNHPPAG